MTGLSPRRKMLKVSGIALAIIGVVIIIFAAFGMGAESFRIQAGPDEALGVAEGDTRFQQFAVGFVGIGSLYLGYRVFKYIPYAEREREHVTELDL
jgi:hypothetical protein